jgi:hypothetical protein
LRSANPLSLISGAKGASLSCHRPYDPGMIEKRHRSAQDDLNRSQPLLGHKTTFKEAYPEVGELSIEVKSFPMGFGRSETFNFSLNNPPGEFCGCPNHSCEGGGFNLGWHLFDMVTTQTLHLETGGACLGHERMNRRASRPCHYSFRAVIDMKFLQG